MAGWFLKNLGVVFVGWFGRCSFILRCQKDHRMIISDWSLWEAVNDLSVWWSGTRRVTMLRLREWNWNIYIYKAHWYWGQGVSPHMMFFCASRKKIMAQLLSRDHWNPTVRLVWWPPRLAVSIRIDDDLRRLLSEAREDVIRTLVYRRQCRHGSRVEMSMVKRDEKPPVVVVT